MLVGNAAEFWLFSDQPYGDSDNLRNASWLLFSIGSLLMDVGATITGVSLWRTPTCPRWISAVLLMALPLDVIAFFAFSPFLAPGVLVIALGWLVSNPDRRVESAGSIAPSA